MPAQGYLKDNQEPCKNQYGIAMFVDGPDANGNTDYVNTTIIKCII